MIMANICYYISNKLENHFNYDGILEENLYDIQNESLIIPILWIYTYVHNKEEILAGHNMVKIDSRFKLEPKKYNTTRI